MQARQQSVEEAAHVCLLHPTWSVVTASMLPLLRLGTGMPARTTLWLGLTTLLCCHQPCTGTFACPTPSGSCKLALHAHLLDTHGMIEQVWPEPHHHTWLFWRNWRNWRNV